MEVKAATNATERHLAGLMALREEGRLKGYVLVCQEPRRRVLDGIEVLPWRAFTDELWSDRRVGGWEAGARRAAERRARDLTDT